MWSKRCLKNHHFIIIKCKLTFLNGEDNVTGLNRTKENSESSTKAMVTNLNFNKKVHLKKFKFDLLLHF